MTQPTILVVEDDPDITHMLAALLSMEGYAVVLATTSADALTQLQHATPT